MADDKLAELLKTQKSLTEWLDDINHADAEAIRKEDNDKRERLKVINRLTGLPFDEPVQFEAKDIADSTAEFKKYLSEHGSETCALRLIPKKENLPKLRMRGKTVKNALTWFFEQKINPSDYRADFVPHAPDYSWATIFVVNPQGIQGEIIYGGHHQLTQGFHDKDTPIVFRYDFSNWTLYPPNEKALGYLKTLVKYLHMPEHNVQDELHQKLGATFVNDYLEGYFESTDSSLGTWFIDYNQTIGKLYKDLVITSPATKSTAIIKGQVGCAGQVEGTVKIMTIDQIGSKLPENSVLVCEVTTPDFVPLMQQAVAIVTDQGGILSHAAIVARELKKPCIVGTGNATKVLKDGQKVRVNGDTGEVVALS